MVKRYEIYWVNLNPTIGSEINKIRPCLIISPDEANRFLRTIIVAPLTSSNKSYKSRINFIFLNKHAQICLDQIRTVDKKRIKGRAGILPNEKILETKQVLQEFLID
ncbi:type II toxin-antitoxin system PemK/MazF family toxin [Membranihabitans maritimus]|uniref:type II toxin-antitoxin system PemK/MazF family toxin n=1 Tax=Membranihabitans maritimus TaxID=2904244 RepID=UPI0034E2C0BD